MPQGRFERTVSDRKLAGVCGGLAKYLGVDALLVRVLWVAISIASVGVGLVAYILLWILAPEEPSGQAAQSASTPPKQ